MIMAVIISVGGILASVATLIMFIWFVMSDPIKLNERWFKRASWGRIKKGTLRMIKHLGASDWRPDVILGVGRSGHIVAGLLVCNLKWEPGNFKLGVVNVQTSTINGARSLAIETSREDITADTKVLLVDGEMYTGQTMETVVNFLRTDSGVREVKSMVLFKRDQTVYAPDFFAFPVSDVLAMPWEWWSRPDRMIHRLRFWPGKRER